MTLFLRPLYRGTFGGEGCGGFQHPAGCPVFSVSFLATYSARQFCMRIIGGLAERCQARSGLWGAGGLLPAPAGANNNRNRASQPPCLTHLRGAIAGPAELFAVTPGVGVEFQSVARVETCFSTLVW